MNLFARIILWGMLLLMLKDTAIDSHQEDKDARSNGTVVARRMH